MDDAAFSVPINTNILATLPSIPPPPSSALIFNDSIDTTNMTNILLIDSTIPDNTEFCDSANANTFPIIYNYYSKTDDLLALFRQKFPASSIQRIALVFHDRGHNIIAPFMNNKLLFEEGDLEDNQTSFSANVSFLISGIKEFRVAHIDFLACNTLQYSNWKSYYDLLASQTSVVVGASNTPTGNVQYGGDWVMESTGQDIKETYFTDSIDHYKYLLGNIYTVTINSVKYTYDTTDTLNGYVSGFDLGIQTANIVSVFTDGFRVVYVASIGFEAFNSCQTLQSLTLPTSSFFTTIGTSAFSFCTSLSSVNLGTSVQIIGVGAFSFCTALQPTITIPASVNDIRDNAFGGCSSLTSFSVDANNNNYSSDADGVLFNKPQTTLVLYPIGKTQTTYTIPSSVTTIGPGVFFRSQYLTSIFIPDSVTFIDYSGMSQCLSLLSIIIPDSVTDIEFVGFSGNTSLTSVTISRSLTIIKDYVFAGCSALPSVIIPKSITSIRDFAFEACTNLSKVYFLQTAPSTIPTFGIRTFEANANPNTAYYYSSITNTSSLNPPTFTNKQIMYIDFTSMATFTGYVNTTSTITYSQLEASGNQIITNDPYVFLVQSVQDGTLNIGTTSPGTPWNLVNNFTIDSTKNAYWTPALTGVGGVRQAFQVVIQDSIGGVSTTNVQVSVNLLLPTLTKVTPFNGAPQTKSTITFLDISGNSNQVVNPPYVYRVQSVPSYGTLQIGTDPNTAPVWNLSTNNTIDPTHTAYWICNTDSSLNTAAFTIIIQDSVGALSSSPANVFVNMSPPTLTTMATFNGTPNAVSLITYNDLNINGNENVYYTAPTYPPAYVYFVQSLTSGTLKIGLSQVAATDYNSVNNKTISASLNAYWSPVPNQSGVRPAFQVAIQDSTESVSTPNVQVSVNLIPPTLNFISTFTNGTPNTEYTITYSQLVAKGDEVVAQKPFVYIVTSVSSGSLKIGGSNPLTAPDWNDPNNNIINATNKSYAYWMPALDASGTTPAFKVVIQDAVGNLTTPPVQVNVALTIPSLTEITPFIGTPNTIREITFLDLSGNGNEVVYNKPFVYLVQWIPYADSSLNIGTSQATANPWSASNKIINVNKNAYWKPPTGVTGLTPAFQVVIEDYLGNVSTPYVQVSVILRAPTLTYIAPFLGFTNTMQTITYIDLSNNGNQVVYNTPYVYLVELLSSGSLKIGTDPNTAPYWSELNKTIDETLTAYWTPETGVSGLTDAFQVVIRDASGNESSPNVQVRVDLQPPTLTTMATFLGYTNTMQTITYLDLSGNGNEVVYKTPYVYLVQSLSSGSLNIGTTSPGTPWSASNKTIDTTHTAYWTPQTGISGTTNAFQVVIEDSTDYLTSPPVQVRVNLQPPTLTYIAPFIAIAYQSTTITYLDISANGNEVVYNTPYVFLVQSLSSGSLKIGTDAITAQPWSESNKTIDLSKSAFWSPPPGAIGSTSAFKVVIQDSTGALSSPPAQVYVDEPFPCFKKGTKILCKNDIYIPIEELKMGDLVKTYKHGYQKVIMSAEIMSAHSNLCNDRENRLNKLYTYSREKNPVLIEDLHITGGHSLLFDSLTEDESNDMKQIGWHPEEFFVEEKYKLLACFSRQLCVAAEQNMEIYHFALEPPKNATPNHVYGIYANGILAETCSKRVMEKTLEKNNILYKLSKTKQK